jgi:hypothetical protein
VAMSDGFLRSSVACRVQGTFPPQGVAGDLANHVVRQSANDTITTLSYGTGSGQADLLVCQDKTINATTAATYDLYTGTDLLDIDGQIAAHRKVKYLKVSVADGGDAAGVRVGGAASDEWAGYFAAAGDKALIFPGGPPFVVGSPAGVAVGTTTKNLLVENLSAVAVTVRIVIAGTSV